MTVNEHCGGGERLKIGELWSFVLCPHLKADWKGFKENLVELLWILCTGGRGDRSASCLRKLKDKVSCGHMKNLRSGTTL